jgi:hypothetical protein
VGGDEDVPRGCVALLCMQNIDVLCHAALRARATGAFLACCLDRSVLDDVVTSFNRQQVAVSMKDQDVLITAAEQATSASTNVQSGAAKPSEGMEAVREPSLSLSKYDAPSP